MLKTVLVPLDGLARAEFILPVVWRTARNTGKTQVQLQMVGFLSEYWPALTTAHPSLAQAVVDADVTQATTYPKKVAFSPEMEGIPVKYVQGV